MNNFHSPLPKGLGTSFWQQLENKEIAKEQVETILLSKLGKPSNLTQSNLLQEFIKKVNAYYFTIEPTNTTTFNLYGYCQEIQAKQFKEGKKRGQTYYWLKLGEPKGESLKASQSDLPKEKWTQLEKLAILGKKLVFTYRKWITNKELLDFEKPKKKPSLAEATLKISSNKAETG